MSRLPLIRTAVWVRPGAGLPLVGLGGEPARAVVRPAAKRERGRERGRPRAAQRKAA